MDEPHIEVKAWKTKKIDSTKAKIIRDLTPTEYKDAYELQKLLVKKAIEDSDVGEGE